ncbi:hypothetical protein [uncultured Desulfovibrio sp.]|uniref:phospholipase D-like domain-containing protein n=1 Tax=uncultured Desulfovibrio sp. TaxID=167968 RepID=UPI00260E40C5|nr:hypothetical protein [uncultured Desulfovibrio sp.]
MSGLLHSLLGTKQSEPEFVTTHGIAAHLETMFYDARSFIIIISPYIRLSLRIRDILDEKKKSGIPITIVHKEPFTPVDIASKRFQRSNLHAKCFLTEQAALIGSMNLYDYSQVNNDELGIYITKEDFPNTYEKMYAEANRLCRNFLLPKSNQKENTSKYTVQLERGKRYSQEEMRNLFAFMDDYPRGIRPTKNGNVVLFSKSHSRYTNYEENGIIYYQGQNTGQGIQQLIYGNKNLYDCFKNPQSRIFFFKDGIFCGEKYICQEPYQENGKWIFPLKDKP